MSPKSLAHKLLQFRASTSLMVPGTLAAQIGYPAMQDALQRGWIQPDHESGYLTLTQQGDRLEEMRRLDETCCTVCCKEECECDKEEKKEESFDRRAFVTAHTTRLHETYGLGTSGTSGGAPGSGQPQPSSTPAQPAAPSPTTPMNRLGQEYMVGETVVVADEGKSYQAKVAAKNQDGTYKLSFGPNRPLKQDRVFRREEMQRLDQQGAAAPAQRP